MRKPISQEKRHEWETKIQQQRQSGLSINKWCKENQTPISTFHQWEDRLYPKQKTPLSLKSFTELTEISGSKGAGIFIEYRGIHIHLEKHFDANVLKNCLAVLREGKC
jgi:hypothetical protein